MAERIGEGSDIDNSHVFITHGGCDPEIAQACADKVRSLGDFPNVHITHANCTVCSHCGPGTLGVLFLRKHPI